MDRVPTSAFHILPKKMLTILIFIVFIVGPSGFDIESKLSADSGFFDGQPSAILVTELELDSDKQKLIAFDKSLQEEIQCNSSRLPTCGKLC